MNKNKKFQKEQLEKIEALAKQELETCTEIKALDDLRIKFLGKKGELTAILKQMGKLSAEERPVIGQLANKVRADIEEALNTKLSSLKANAQAAKLAYPANLAAIATVVASVMTVAATIASLINASKFANGGIVDAASRVGDHNIIRVNGGEMILNDRQQSNLFKLLNGEFWAYYNSNNFGIGKHETIQLRISGSDLVGTLDNYNRQQGRAR